MSLTRRILLAVVIVSVVASQVTAQLSIRKARQTITEQFALLKDQDAWLKNAARSLEQAGALLNACHCALPTAAPDTSASSIIHMPPSGKCPDGDSFYENGVFTEKDGSKQRACWNPKGDGSIDVLHPDEEFRGGFQIEMPGKGRKGKV